MPTTAPATVTGNVFADNEGGGIALFSGSDTVTCNTFTRNAVEGLSAAGKAFPVVERNLFVANAAGVLCFSVADVTPEPKPVGHPRLKDNWFWKNETTVSLWPGAAAAGRQAPWAKLDAEAGNVERDPGFAGADTITLAPDGPAAKAGVGAAACPSPAKPLADAGPGIGHHSRGVRARLPALEEAGAGAAAGRGGGAGRHGRGRRPRPCPTPTPSRTSTRCSAAEYPCFEMKKSTGTRSGRNCSAGERSEGRAGVWAAVP